MKIFEIVLTIIVVLFIALLIGMFITTEKETRGLYSATEEYQIEKFCHSNYISNLHLTQLPVKCLKYYDRR